MVTGADKDRLGLLLGLVYAFAALLTLVPALLRRGRDDQPPTDHPIAATPPPMSAVTTSRG